MKQDIQNDLRLVKFKCRLAASVCNNKQRWNNEKCKYECKELIDKGRCHKGFIWNPNNVNMINHVMLENIYTTKTVNIEKN